MLVYWVKFQLCKTTFFISSTVSLIQMSPELTNFDHKKTAFEKSGLKFNDFGCVINY